MSFDYSFEYPDDKVYFAYSEPYTFSGLSNFLSGIIQQQAKLPLEEQYVKQDTLCKTITGVEVPLLAITSKINTPDAELASPPTQDTIKEIQREEDPLMLDEDSTKWREEFMMKISKEKKQVLIVTSRVHPGEVCGSFVMHEFIRFLVSNDSRAIELRSKLSILIVPMINVDGVIIGNYRCGISGIDLNRSFASPDPKLQPAVSSIKKLIGQLQASGRSIFGYIDLHAHSTKKCVFIYGPYYPLHAERYVRVRILSKLLSERTQMFRYAACKYRKEPGKMNAARFVISREFNVTNSLTLESSFYGFLNEERKTIEFSRLFYERMGMHLALSILDYVKLLEEEKLRLLKRLYEKERRQKIIGKKKKKKKVKDVDFMESPKKVVLLEAKKMNNSKKSEESSPSISPPPMILSEPPEEEKQDIEQNNPNDSTARKVIRLEETSEHPELFADNKPTKIYKMNDLFNSIKEDIKREQLEDAEEGSDSSSSECDMLTVEEEANVMNGILNAINGVSCNDEMPSRPKTAKGQEIPVKGSMHNSTQQTTSRENLECKKENEKAISKKITKKQESVGKTNDFRVRHIE